MEKSEFKELIGKAINCLEKSPEIPVDLFDELAVLFLTRGKLQVGKATFRFKEIEFYLNNVEDKTSKEGYDLFAHKHDNRFEELKTGGIRPHNSGLDIAIREPQNFFGGILIRCLQKVNDDKRSLTGPVLTMFTLLSEIGDITEGPKSLELTFDSEQLDLKIKATRRIGLKTQHSGGENFEKFKKAGWRYHTYEPGKDPKGIKDIREVP